MRYYILLLIGMLMMTSMDAQVYVSDSDDLQNFVNAASPGDTFIVSNGTYVDFEGSFTSSGALNNPIVIKAETVGGVILTGESHFVFKKAAHIILEGFVFDATGDDTMVKLEGCNNIRITRNVFELQTTQSIKWVYVGGYWSDNTFQFASHHNRIDHNLFQNKNTPGHYITIDGSNDGNDDYRQSKYDRIDHNHFKNNGPRAANEQESIRIGWSEMSMSSGFTTVEHNLFENCDGDPEIISVKSCDNIIRHNTFRSSYGTLSLRHGNRNHVEGNFFFGEGKPNGTFTNSNGSTSTIYTGGIRIYGTDHVIVNNYFEGLEGTRWDAPITLTQGDAIDGSSTNWSKHFRAERVTIAYNTLVNNTHGIEIGFDNNGDYGKSLKDISITNNLVMGNQNSLIAYKDGNTQGSEITWTNNLMFPTGSATLTNNGTSFDTTEIRVQDPMLAYDSTMWRATAASPIDTNGIYSFVNTQDMDGQTRPMLSNYGSDHYSMDSILYKPMTASDVGPGSSGTTSTPYLSTDYVDIKIYPNPASEYFIIDDIPQGLSRIDVFNIKGEWIAGKDIVAGITQENINISSYAKGMYLVTFTGERGRFAKKIMIVK